ncbi:MAG: nitronate monooxygenase [Rhodocyclaceae bacterium]|nr:nitronate monooxygenase [Rhodocyclaceae bacterium]
MRKAEALLREAPICSLLGITWPVLQAGMGQVAYGDLVGEVSAAGGLGVLGAGYMSGDELRGEIRKVRARTGRPFGVDILFGQVQSDDQGSQRYSQRVEDQIEASLDERVPVLISGLGNPSGVIPRAHALGIKIMSVVGNARQARQVVADGVDAVIASGAEGGGHVGRVGTATLVPMVVDAVAAIRKVPVIAGGGLADGRGLAAAFALGACGTWMGTRFIATREARGHDHYKNRIVAIDEEGTVVTRGHSGKPCRLIRNRFTEYWEAHPEQIQPFPKQMVEVGEPATLRGRLEGDIENGVLPAGQSSGLIHGVIGAGDVVAQVVAEAIDTFERLGVGF